MTEDAEDHEIFDINDFTTASDWERFIVRIEEIVNEWKLANSDNEKLNIDLTNSIWREKADTIQFSEISFTITRYYLEEVKKKESQENEAVVVVHDEKKESSPVPPRSMADLFNQVNDFKNAPIIAYWYGLYDYLVISPTRANEVITSETKANILLSSASIAINNTGCSVPIFIQVHAKPRNMFIGLCEGSALKTHFQIVHFNYIPSQYGYLSGLLEIFKSKLGAHLIDPSPLIFASIRFTYVLQDCIMNTLSEFQHEVNITDVEPLDFKNLPFGALQDSIDTIYLSCIWPSLSEDMIIESETYSDLDPLKSSDWSIYLTTLDDALDLQLTQLLQGFYDHIKKTISVSQIISGITNSSGDETQNEAAADYKQSLEKLINPIAKTSTHRTLRSLMKPVVDKAANTMKQLNALSTEAPLEKVVIDEIMNFLFPDATGSQNDIPIMKSLLLNEPDNEVIKRLLSKMDSMKASKSDDTNNCLLNKLAICMAIVNQVGSVKAIAQLWNEFVLELRFRWDSMILITDISTGTPDLSRSLLHQKLQMLNCCIQKKIERDEFINKQNSLDNDNDADEFFDCENDVSMNESQPDGRHKQCGDLFLLNNKAEPLFIPITQESTPMTEDMIEEHASVLVNLGCSSDAALLRAKIQSASLLSDMESFKAANPECVLEDFVRWYSPRDWLEVECINLETNEVEKKFDLSNRMKISGNMWIEVWNSAKAVPVRKQKRLFDDTKEAERVFDWLNSMSVGYLVEQLLPMLFYSSILCVLNESKDIINDYEMLVDSLIDKTVKATRNSNEVKKYQELINYIKTAEKYVSKMQSLRKKFTLDINTDECTADELNGFLNLLLKSTVNYQQEVKIKNGANSSLGKLIVKLCKTYAKSQSPNVEVEVEDELASNTEETPITDDSILRKPYKREYILRASASRPTPYSRQSPQRMYCLLSSGEFRLAGAFSEDTMFF